MKLAGRQKQRVGETPASEVGILSKIPNSEMLLAFNSRQVEEKVIKIV